MRRPLCLAAGLLLSLLLLAALLSSSDDAHAATHVVPDDFPTVPSAVENASAGDTIRIFDGVHYPSGDPDAPSAVTVNKRLTIVGNGTGRTTIVGGTMALLMRVGSSGSLVSGIHFSANGTGISLFYANDCNLRDVLVTDADTALNIEVGDRNTISDSVLLGGRWGTEIKDGACDNAFFNVSFRGSRLGLDLGEGGRCDRNTFTNCSFDECGFGAEVHGGECVFSGCIFNDNEVDGLFLYGDRHLVEGCTADGNGRGGMRFMLFSAGGSTIRDCVARSNVEYGLWMRYVSKTTFANLTLADNELGVFSQQSLENEYAGCNISSNGIGGTFVTSSGTLIVNSTLNSNSAQGLVLDNSSSGTRIENCIIARNAGDGILIKGNPLGIWPGVLIRGNRIDGNGRAGLKMESVGRATVVSNNITRCGVCALDASTSEGNNLFYLNFFLDNTAHVAFPRANERYDNGTLGNYWDDYLARYPNARRVGLVWDTPYEVVAGDGVFDNYPLAWGWEDNPPVADAGPDRRVELGDEVLLDGSNSTDDSAIDRYRWSVQGPSGRVEQRVSREPLWKVDPAELGVHVATLTVYDVWDNLDRDTALITVVDTTPPTVDAGADVTLDVGTTATLSPALAWDLAGVDGYLWTVDPGGMNVTFDSGDASVTFPSVGTYRVVLRVWDASGNWAEDELSVEVVDTVPPVAVPGPYVVMDQGDTALLDGSGSHDNVAVVRWVWSYTVGGTILALEGAEVGITLDLPGTFRVTLTVWDAAGNSDEGTLMIAVRDTEHPVADAGPDQRVGQGVAVSLDAGNSTDNVGVVGFQWSFTYLGEVHQLESAEASFAFDAPGTYGVDLWVWDGAGNRANDSMVVTVVDTEPPVAVASGPEEVKVDAKAVLDGRGSRDNVGVVDHVWTYIYRGEERVLTGAVVELSFGAPGEYEMTLTVKDAEGNTGTDAVRVRVSATPREVEMSDWNPWIVLLLVVVIVAALLLVLRSRRGDDRGT